jgi:hypothetical protein
MASGGSDRDEHQGLRRISTGATVGLSAGIVGLILPVGLFLLASYSPSTFFLSPSSLIQLTAILALAGAILFAVSLTFYRMGFWSLMSFDHRFWAASALCLLGTVGVILVILPMALAFASSDVMASCIQGAPTKALVCLDSAAPLASYLGTLGVWMLWVGGLGVVVGIGLASVRYRQLWLIAGAGLYAVLLLVMVAPILGVLLPSDLVYPFFLLPFLVLLAPALISKGSRRAVSGEFDGRVLPSG